MKKIMKLFPVALGVIALASCSNDENFLGSEQDLNAPELIVSTEAPFGEDATRAAFETVSGSYSVSWQAGDQFRVYDAALQKYDVYMTYVDGTTKRIALTGVSHVETPDKAIFPGNRVQYAGWDKTNDVVTTTMLVPASVNSVNQEAATVNGAETFAYVSALPMWGNASKNGDNLEVSLKMLTAYTDITLYKSAGVTNVRLVSLKASPANAATDADAADLNASFPLAGYFDAQLKEGGQLVQTSGDLKNLDKSMIIGVTNIPAVDSVHVIIPVIPARYPYLSVQYSTDNGATWTELKSYKNVEIGRNVLLKNGLTVGDAPITARVTNLAQLNTRLAYIANTYPGKTVDIYLDGEVATSEAAQILSIPTTLTQDQTINIKGEIKNNIPNLPLQITGGTAGKKMTLNVEGGINGSENVIINTTGDLQLIGAVTSTGTGANHGTIKVDGVGTTLTLGKGEFGAFNTGMIVEMNAAKAIEINAGTGTVATLNVKSTGTVTVTSGTVTTLTNASASTGAITVNGTVGTLTAAGNAPITVGWSGNVTTLTANGGAAAVSVNGSVNTLSTKSTNITIGSYTIENVTLNATAAGSLNLNAGTITNLKSNASAAITVSSTGRAAIVNYSTNNGKTACTFTSQLTANAANQKVNASLINANGEIYTAAQLAAVTTGKNYKLMGDIDINNKVWNTPNLNGNFDGNGKTISNIKQALFNTVSGGEIKNFTIATAINENAATQGSIARTVNGTVTIKDVTVTGSVATTNGGDRADVGGLIGKVSGGTLTLQDNKLTLTALNGYMNVGGYIGNVAGGTVNILTTKANTDKQSAIVFGWVGKNAVTAANAGTFGNFIGSITGAANVTIGGTGNNANAGKDISNFFAIASPNGIYDGTKANALYYSINKNASNAPFLGMQQTLFGTYTFHYEIGRSTNVGTLKIYDSIVDDLGNPYTLTLSDINQY